MWCLPPLTKGFGVVTSIAPAAPAVTEAEGRAEEADAVERCGVEKSLESAISGVRHCRVKLDARRFDGVEKGKLVRCMCAWESVRSSHARPAPSPPRACCPSASLEGEEIAPICTTSYPSTSTRKAAGVTRGVST
jgi:hypothetical protein